MQLNRKASFRVTAIKFPNEKVNPSRRALLLPCGIRPCMTPGMGVRARV